MSLLPTVSPLSKWRSTLEDALRQGGEVEDRTQNCEDSSTMENVEDSSCTTRLAPEEEEEMVSSLKVVSRAQLMARFLISHKRVKGPEQEEVDLWMQAYPGKTFSYPVLEFACFGFVTSSN